MHKVVISVALVALVAGLAAAQPQTIHVPDAVTCTNTGQSWPFRFPSTSGRYQEFLLSQYLPQQPVRITDVAFSRAFGTQVFTATQFQLRMAHTTFGCTPSNNFDTNLGLCPTNLIDFQGPGTFTYNPPQTTFTEIGTTCDFGYDGQRNICMEIRYRGKPSGLTGVIACFANQLPRVYANSTTADNYAATASTSAPSCSSGLKVRLTYTTNCVLLAPDTIKVGQSGTINLRGFPAASVYQLAASFGQSFIINFGNCSLCLDPDDLFGLSVTLGPPLFVNYQALVPASGQGAGTLNVPNIPQLAGICIYHAAVAIQQGIACCTNTAGTRIIP